MFKTLTTAPHRFKGILTLGFRASSDRRGSDLCGSELAHFRRAPPRNLGCVLLGTPRTLVLASCLRLAPLLSEAGRDFPLPPGAPSPESTRLARGRTEQHPTHCMSPAGSWFIIHECDTFIEYLLRARQETPRPTGRLPPTSGICPLPLLKSFRKFFNKIETQKN